MLPEQEQRILGYFIEEAKDHLNTIEQGLLNLQHVLKDPEMVNEIFRAAHSIKGGAAMLGLNSIQQTAHHLEDYFKILQESDPLCIDQKLESLLLRVFDTLQELLEQLESPFGLSLEVANRLMSEVEPVFAALHQHLALLVNQECNKKHAVPQFAGSSMQVEEIATPIPEEIALVSLNVNQYSDPVDETLAIDSLFEEAEATSLLSALEEPKGDDLFNDLFDTKEETEESLELLEALTYESSTEEVKQVLAPTPEENWLASLDDIFSDIESPAPRVEDEPTDFDLEWLETGNPTQQLDELEDFAELEALLEITPLERMGSLTDESSLLEALLGLDSNLVPGQGSQLYTGEYEELDLLQEVTGVLPSQKSVSDAESLTVADLSTEEEVLTADMGSAVVRQNQEQAVTTNPRRAVFEQTMRVPVKQLDNVSNLVGELVVYRNSLEQDQVRLRQFLDNLLHQVQQLNDVGSRMQALYERSLLEASLLNTRQSFQPASPSDQLAASGHHATGMNFDALEMDRFTGFHSLSQEILELIVKVRESSSDIEFIADETDQVARQFRQVTNQLQEGLTRSRMLPLATISDRLPRAVRDIALEYGKQAALQIDGHDTLIDKVILEQLYDPMTHLVNNAITHGIETPEERSAQGKSPIGQITIRAFHQGNQTVIAVADDGAGIDPEGVKAKAVQKGLITSEQAKTLSRLDVYNLLFHPGFSTRDQVDNFAGRGVGMDVVQTSLSEMRGEINIDSTLGKGTTFTIRLPLTLSICKALCCLSDKARIAFPMDGVEDMIDVPETNVCLNAEGQSCISWRNSLMPLRPLKELLSYNRQLSRGNVYGGNREDGMISIVVIRSASTLLALQVDQVLGEQEIVIKQFEGPVPRPVGVAGATVLGDGRVMPIADVLELIDLSMGRIEREGSTKWARLAQTGLPETPALFKIEPTVLIVDDSITVRELLSLTFNKAGYRVEQARDGQEAWDKLRDGLPCDIIFCDIEMPKMDGLELLSRLQQDPSFSQIPVAMLTSRGADRHRQMAIQLGASGYFTKPYLEEALLDAVQRMLGGEVMVTSNSNA